LNQRNTVMKLVISPAKSLDFERKVPVPQSSEFCFQKEAERLNRLLKKKSARSLSKLMNISPALGQLNYERNQEWQFPFPTDKSRQAAYAFNGDVYRGLNVYELPKGKIDQLQNTVRIISGLYGLLKPLDVIMPYRLEMGSRLPVGKNKNLYAFWKKKVTQALNDELEDDEVFLNLASNEYFKAIDSKALKVPIYNVQFKEFKEGKFVMIGFFAKYARGLMARYVLDTNAQSIKEVKGFNYEDYGYSEELSTEYNLVFTR